MNLIRFLVQNYLALLSVVTLCLFANCVPQRDEQATLIKILQFRQMSTGKVYPNSSFVHQFIQDDLYSLRWLEESNFDVKQAHNNFMEHLRWRAKENMDTIHLYDWSFYMEEYPFYVGNVDKFGRPLTECWFSDWDIRRAIVSGFVEQLARRFYFVKEMEQRALYATRAVPGFGNITGVTEILDVAGFNRRQHTCTACVSFFTRINAVSQKQYPNIVHTVYMVNAGPVFRAFVGAGQKRANYGRGTQLKLYSDKIEWLPVLDKNIDKNQRSIRFGGSISRN